MSNHFVHPTVAIARRLLADQVHSLANHEPVLVAHGWDNDMYRVGDEYALRLPRRSESVPLIAHEQRSIPEIAPRCTVAVPEQIVIGRPTEYFPAPWSLVRWLAGRTVAETWPNGLGDHPLGGLLAADIGAFLASVHTPAPADAPPNAWRGVPLADRLQVWDDRLARAGALVKVPDAQALMNRAVAAPVYSGPSLWLHGDSHPFNLLVDEGGRLCGAIDWGDVCSGDPASDLAVAYMLGSRVRLSELLDAYPSDHPVASDSSIELRVAGWAATLGLAMVIDPLSDDRFRALGRSVLALLGLMKES